jgi:hypothetical protein
MEANLLTEWDVCTLWDALGSTKVKNAYVHEECRVTHISCQGSGVNGARPSANRQVEAFAKSRLARLSMRWWSSYLNAPEGSPTKELTTLINRPPMRIIPFRPDIEFSAQAQSFFRFGG